MDILSALMLVLTGSVIVIIGAVLGIGAGFIVIPILVLFFDIPIHTAITTSLISIIAISLSVGAENIRRGFVNIKLATLLEFTAALGAVIGAYTAVKTNPENLKTVFSFILMLAAVIMIKKTFFKNKTHNTVEKFQVAKDLDGKIYDYQNKKILRYETKNTPFAMIGTFLAGSLSGLVGIGGGIVNVPLLTLVCKLPIKAASATSSYMLAVTASAGVVVYIFNGFLNTEITVPLVLGIIAFGSLGAKILRNIKSKYVEILFAGVLLFTAIRMFLR